VSTIGGPLRRRPEHHAIVTIALAWAAVGVMHLAAPGGAATTPALWIAMSAAMMGPAALPAARHVALNSLRRLRRQAVLTFFTGYVAVWMVFGVVALPAAAVVQGATGADAALAGALALAALWQLLPYRRSYLRACRRTVPLRPRGWRATLSCLRFSVRYGVGCVGVCWPLMLVMAVLVHAGLAWMVALTVAAALARAPRRSYTLAAGFAVAAAATVLLAPLAVDAAAERHTQDKPPAWRCVLG
jgi:predicted metal-binding membrane protein